MSEVGSLPRYRRAPDVACRTVDGTTVIVVVQQQALHSLNPVGSWLWETLGEETFDREAAAGRIVEAFDLPEDVARRDVDAFLDEMVAKGAFEQVIE